MAFAHSDLDYRRGGKRKDGFHIDLSFTRHFVGLFALSFSSAVLFTIAHYVFRV